MKMKTREKSEDSSAAIVTFKHFNVKWWTFVALRMVKPVSENKIRSVIFLIEIDTFVSNAFQME